MKKAAKRKIAHSRKRKSKSKNSLLLLAALIIAIAGFVVWAVIARSPSKTPEAATGVSVSVSGQPLLFRNSVCLAGTSTCQPYVYTYGTYTNWKLASLVNYDLKVDVEVFDSGDKSKPNYVFWEKQNNVGINCYGPATCSKKLSWAKVDYIINTTIDNTDHIVPGIATYTYTSVQPGLSYKGTVKMKDYDNFGNLHTVGTLIGTAPGGPIPTPSPTPIKNNVCDFNKDGVVNSADSQIVGDHFTQSGTGLIWDLDKDGKVTILDITIVSSKSTKYCI